MGKVVSLNSYGPLTLKQCSQYVKALGKVRHQKVIEKANCRNLESKFGDMKNLLEAITGGEDNRNYRLVDKMREINLVREVGRDLVEKYLVATEEIYAQVEEWRDKEFNKEFAEELKIIKRYEARYNKHHKD